MDIKAPGAPDFKCDKERKKIMKLREKILSGLVMAGILSAGFMTGCSSSSGTSSASSSAPESTSSAAQSESSAEESSSGDTAVSGDLITVYGVIDPQISAQQIIADKMGYYKEFGLNVKNEFLSQGGDMASYIANGTAQVSFETSYTTTPLKASNVGVKMLATVNNIGATQAVVAAKDSGISSPKDMEGKKIGMGAGSGVVIAIQKCCEEYGVDFSKLEFVTIGPSDQLAAMENGSIDMMACWEPWVSKAQNDLGGTLLFTGTHSYFEGLDSDKSWLNFYTTLQVTDEFLASHSNECEALIKAYAKATDYINSNMEEASKIIGEELNLTTEEVLGIMKKNVYDMKWTDDFKNATDSIAQNILDNGNIESIPEFSTYADPTPLKNACPELFTATNI